MLMDDSTVTVDDLKVDVDGGVLTHDHWGWTEPYDLG